MPSAPLPERLRFAEFTLDRLPNGRCRARVGLTWRDSEQFTGEGEGLAPNVAAVAVQSLNTDARLVVAALKAREQEELVERLEELETLMQHQKEERHRGA